MHPIGIPGVQDHIIKDHLRRIWRVEISAMVAPIHKYSTLNTVKDMLRTIHQGIGIASRSIAILIQDLNFIMVRIIERHIDEGGDFYLSTSLKVEHVQVGAAQT